MESCNNAKTPIALTPLGKDGESFNEAWNYATIVGMLMYLSTNIRPDITFAVNQYARFTHNPKNSHPINVKKRLRYLWGKKDKGMDLNPTGSYNVDCCVDADFAEL